MAEFSDFIVYADESGDHGLSGIDLQFPVFALAFCVMRKTEYIARVVPAVQSLKFRIWGHDTLILHEHDIRKSKGPFATLLTDEALRQRVYDGLNGLIEGAPMTIFASVIDKIELREIYVNPWNPYRIAMHFCMERLHEMLIRERQDGKTVHVVFESRGRKEDRALECEFRRIAGNRGHWGNRRPNFSRFDFQPIFVPKSANSSGLQLADLIVRPVALSQLRPDQPNRAFAIVQPKLAGLKRFPERLQER